MSLENKYTTIIVDDEPHARFRLKQILEQTGKFDIIAEAKDGVDGKNIVNKLKPEVVFLDIQMPEINGFEMLEHICYDPFVIFCTAFNQYAIKAFETHSVDYLLKPVELPRLVTTIEKLRRISEQKSMIKQMQAELQERVSDKKSDIIPIKIGDRIILINLEQVAYFEAKEKSVFLYNLSGKKYVTDHSLQILESKLPNPFIRVSRSVVVNKNIISECRKYFKGKYILVLNDKNSSRITTGSTYSERLKKLLEF